MLSKDKKVGRKTVMTETVLRKLREAFLWGCTDREACLFAGISETAFYQYQSHHSEFTEQKQLLKSNPVLKARKTVFSNLDDPKIATWYLERKRRAEFGTKFIQQECYEEPCLSEKDKQQIGDLLTQEGYEVVW